MRKVTYTLGGDPEQCIVLDVPTEAAKNPVFYISEDNGEVVFSIRRNPKRVILTPFVVSPGVDAPAVYLSRLEDICRGKNQSLDEMVFVELIFQGSDKRSYAVVPEGTRWEGVRCLII